LKSGKYHFRIIGASLLSRASARYGKLALLFAAFLLRNFLELKTEKSLNAFVDCNSYSDAEEMGKVKG
jgi:hypothetical protein